MEIKIILTCFFFITLIFGPCVFMKRCLTSKIKKHKKNNTPKYSDTVCIDTTVKGNDFLFVIDFRETVLDMTEPYYVLGLWVSIYFCLFYF